MKIDHFTLREVSKSLQSMSADRIAHKNTKRTLRVFSKARIFSARLISPALHADGHVAVLATESSVSFILFPVLLSVSTAHPASVLDS
jgi:hypothetical protein